MVRTHAAIHVEDMPQGHLISGTTRCGEYFNVDEQIPIIVIHPAYLGDVMPSCPTCWKEVVNQTIEDAGTHHC